MDYKLLWTNFLHKIAEKLTPINYSTWFVETELIEIKEDLAIVLVPTHVHQKHLNESYYDLIIDTFNEITGSYFKFEFYIKEELENEIFSIEKIGVPSKKDFISNLNPLYNFENFVVGESNKFARTAALAVAEKPAQMYNPLFIFSKSGLGKTHLMHALGNHINHNHNLKVLYVTSEQFVSDFIELYRKNKNDNNLDAVDSFKQKYRDIDVLMIDDIQFLEVALKSQQEFFNTFNDLHTKNKQIVISSDRSPDDLHQLEERLRTRFSWGLMVDIKPPNFELRIDIITKKVELYPSIANFPQDVKEYIASNCITDIRKLEGAITRIVAYATMMNKPKINLNLATEALIGYFDNCIISKNQLDKIQQVVAQHYNISIDDMKSKKRITEIAIPRQVAMYIARTIFNESLTKIGNSFGGKNHTTVMHSVEKITKLFEKDEKFKTELNKLINKLK